MREIYIDIMETVLSAYDSDRIRDYIDEVKLDGLKEHGFPRLTADIGILISFGRHTELLSTFEEMMDICCEEIPRVKAANDFSVREICCLLMLLQQKNTVEKSKIEKWKAKIRSFDPCQGYTVIAKSPYEPVGNWAAFAAVSEFIRGVCCGIDTHEFVDWEVSSQLLSFDSNGMYKDPHNPMVYDAVTRVLMCFLIKFGYDGKLKEKIEDLLEKSVELTLKMQSVTGEIPFGGRSNQFLHNEVVYAAFYEYFASVYAKRGDPGKAGELKSAALLCAESLKKWLKKEPISHIKNSYGIDSGIGCENYGYFNKYMITVASFAYMAFLLSDDTVMATATVNEQGSYIAETSKDFHKIFLCGGGYFAEIDTDADFAYDANGLGRVHKKGCHPAVCLSVPFPGKETNYRTERENREPMSICCYIQKDGQYITGADGGCCYRLIESEQNGQEVTARIDCTLCCGITVSEKYSMSKDGVKIELSGCDSCGFMVPVFDFDGMKNTDITVQNGKITTRYGDSQCEYTFDGEIIGNDCFYYNRNGRYRVYRVKSKILNINILKEW